MKFSIIIPTYNRGHIVGKAVESVLGQAFQDWELIIVDDGSVDQTPGTLNNFRNERIKIFRYTENKGASFARNFGLFKAKGSFIIFLDSDDRFVPGALDTISGILKSTNEFYNDYLLRQMNLRVNHIIFECRIKTEKLISKKYLGEN